MSFLLTRAYDALSVTSGVLAANSVITSKILADNVTGAKIRLDNSEYLRGRNAANSADINMIYVSNADRVQFPTTPFLETGVIQGATFEGSSIDTNAASTNSGAVSILSGDASGATSNSGSVTIQSGTATGTRGNVVLNGLDINLDAADDIIGTGDVFDVSAMEMFHIATNAADPTGTAEGQMYYNSTSNAVKFYDGASWVSLGTGSAADWEVEVYVLSAGNITAGYIDGGFACVASSLQFTVKGLGPLIEGASYDYTVAPTGGVGSVCRTTWLNDLVGGQALVAGDVVQIRYQRA